MAEKVKKEKRNIFKKIGAFFREVKVEAFSRIIWPTFKQTRNNTIVVLVTVLVVGAVVWLLDFAFSSALKFALGI